MSVRVRWHSTAIPGDGEAVNRVLGVSEIRDVLASSEPRAVPFDVDPDDLAAAGWGVVLGDGVPGAVRQALEPLVAMRRQQAGRLYQELEYSGEGVARFLRNHGAVRARGPLDPERLPYYLLLVGDPEQIPFELQFDLSLQRAVGRIHFDQPSSARQWVDHVLNSENAACPPGLTIFAPRNDDDPQTASSVSELARPLAEGFASRTGWPVRQAIGMDGTKLKLAQMLSGNSGGLVFSASHAVCFRAGHRRQRGEQGALVCADWPGPHRWRGSLPPRFLFSAEDLPEESLSAGRIAFCFACYSLGTPQNNLYVRPTKGRSVLAPRPFISRLSLAMLSHPAGGLSALVGYVDQTFASSFSSPLDGERVGTFLETLAALACGQRLGGALKCFSHRYAELATAIAESLWAVPESEMSEEDRIQLDKLWQAFQDARSFGVLGDPAVRLEVSGS